MIISLTSTWIISNYLKFIMLFNHWHQNCRDIQTEVSNLNVHFNQLGRPAGPGHRDPTLWWPGRSLTALQARRTSAKWPGGVHILHIEIMIAYCAYYAYYFAYFAYWSHQVMYFKSWSKLHIGHLHIIQQHVEDIILPRHYLTYSAY